MPNGKPFIGMPCQLMGWVNLIQSVPSITTITSFKKYVLSGSAMATTLARALATRFRA